MLDLLDVLFANVKMAYVSIPQESGESEMRAQKF